MIIFNGLTMDFEELKQAAQVFDRINDILNYVTKERFANAAQALFGIDEEDVIDVMYGMLQMTPRLVYYIANFGVEGTEQPKRIKYLPKAVEIAESAYSLKPKDWDMADVPHIEHDIYQREDKRRYFYTDGGRRLRLDVSMSSRSDLLLLSDLLRREVRICGVARHLGYLEGRLNGCKGREKLQYFEGDLYLLYGDPTDRVFYDWTRAKDSGVYVATEKGWRKLLYTPTRGYLERDGELSFADDKHFYSDYMLEASGKGYLYVGNIHDDMSVLVEKKENCAVKPIKENNDYESN